MFDFVMRVECRITLVFLVTINAFPFDVILFVCYNVIRIVVVIGITIILDGMSGLMMKRMRLVLRF